MGLDIDSLVRRNKGELGQLEQLLGYRFTDLKLLQLGLVHSSYAFENGTAGEDNEKLEFLGDAVLDLVIGHLLYQKYTDLREGKLTKLRASLVNEHHLALVAREIRLGEFLELGKGEDASHGRQKSSILSCAFEALMGAIYVDGGYESVRQVVEQLFLPHLQGKKDELLIADSKSRLQEELQEKYNEGPTYRLDNEEGPGHQKNFTISVCFRGQVLGTGSAGSKKEAAQRAAAEALVRLREEALT